MFCTQCGSQMPEGGVCPKCGFTAAKAAAPKAAPRPAAAKPAPQPADFTNWAPQTYEVLSKRRPSKRSPLLLIGSAAVLVLAALLIGLWAGGVFAPAEPVEDDDDRRPSHSDTKDTESTDPSDDETRPQNTDVGTDADDHGGEARPVDTTPDVTMDVSSDGDITPGGNTTQEDSTDGDLTPDDTEPSGGSSGIPGFLGQGNTSDSEENSPTFPTGNEASTVDSPSEGGSGNHSFTLPDGKPFPDFVERGFVIRFSWN